jgi:hypothetical protein
LSKLSILKRVKDYKIDARPRIKPLAYLSNNEKVKKKNETKLSKWDRSILLVHMVNGEEEKGLQEW